MRGNHKGSDSGFHYHLSLAGARKDGGYATLKRARGGYRGLLTITVTVTPQRYQRAASRGISIPNHAHLPTFH